MGGSSSVPESPRTSSDMSIADMVKDTKDEGRSPSERDPIESDSTDRMCLPRACREDPESECVDDDDDEDDDDSEDDDSCDEDSDDDECDDDEEKDDDEEFDEEEEEECEESGRRQAFTPCREPPKPVKEESDDKGVDSSRRESPPYKRKSRRRDSEERVYTPCRDLPRRRKSSEEIDARGRSTERERSQERKDSKGLLKRKDGSSPPPCRDPPNKSSPPKTSSPSGSCSVKMSPPYDRKPKLPCDESPRESPKKQYPCSNKPPPPKEESRGFCSITTIRNALFSPPKAPEEPPKKGRSCSPLRKPTEPICQGEGEPRAILAKQQKSVRDKERKLSIERNNEPGTSLSSKKLRCVKSSDPCKKERESKDEAGNFNGETLKDLHKGCAYMSKRELHKVCNKYKAYGYGSYADEDTEETNYQPSKQKTEENCQPRKLNAESRLGRSDLPRVATGYSGSLGPCNMANEISRERSTSPVDTQMSSLSLNPEHAAAIPGGGQRVRSAERRSPDRATGNYTSASRRVNKGRWRSRSNTPKNITIILNKTPPQRVTTPDEEPGDSVQNVNANNLDQFDSFRDVSRSRSTSEDVDLNGSEIGDVDLHSSLCRSSSSAVDKRNGLSRSFDYENKTNSNNVDLVAQTDQAGMECKDDAETANASKNSMCLDGQPSIDELWFECLETESTSGGFDDTLFYVDAFCGYKRTFHELEFFPGTGALGAFSRAKSRVDQNVPSFSEQISSSPEIDFPPSLPTYSSSLHKCDQASPRFVGPCMFHESQVSARPACDSTSEMGTDCRGSSTRQTVSETNLSTCVDDTSLYSSGYLRSGIRLDSTNVSNQNINANADSLIHSKKQVQKSAQDQRVSNSDLDMLVSFAHAQNYPSFDLGVARGLGLSNEEIKELLLSIFSTPEERPERLERLRGRFFDVDLAREMGLSRSQIKVLLESPSELARSESLVFDIDVARQMGLNPAETETLTRSISPLNHAKYMLMMGESSFDPGLALSMGLTPEQVSQLSDSSLLVSRATVANMEADLARAEGISGSKLKRLTSSWSQSSRTGHASYRRQTLKSAGLSDHQIDLLAKTSKLMLQQQQENRPVFLDKNMARQMGLGEEQIKQLAHNSTKRMLGQSMFDPYLSLRLGMSVNQIKRLATSAADRKPKVAINKALARSMGLSDAQISVLKESLPRIEQADFDPTVFANKNLFDIALASSLGLHTREINTLLASSSTGSLVQIQPQQKSRAQIQHTENPTKPAFTRRPAKFPVELAAREDKAARKAALRRKLLLSRLQESVSDGDKVGDVLNTLLEWNSSLLVVIFLLLLGTGCPRAMKNFLPCPVSPACDTLNAYVIRPLGIHLVWHELAVGWNVTTAEMPSTGTVYVFVYQLYKTIAAVLGAIWRFLFTNILVAIATLPGTVGVPLLKLLLDAIYCTVHITAYYLYYACAMFLGLPAPPPLNDCTQKGKASTQRPEKTAGDLEGDPLEPFDPTQAEQPLVPDLHTLHQYGGFLFYVGFDPPRKGCNYSSISCFCLWLVNSLPEECA